MIAVDVIFVVAVLVLLGANACAWAERADGRADR